MKDGVSVDIVIGMEKRLNRSHDILVRTFSSFTVVKILKSLSPKSPKVLGTDSPSVCNLPLPSYNILPRHLPTISTSSHVKRITPKYKGSHSS